MKKGINDKLDNLITEFTRDAKLYSKQTTKDVYMALLGIFIRHLRDDGYLKLPGIGEFKVSRHVQRVVGLKQGDLGHKEIMRVSFRTSRQLGDMIKLNTK